jgi:GT2 family glycosyltransferase
MTISVLIPSWKRPESLARCLDALERQTRLPDQVVLSVRPDDAPTREMIAARKSPFPLDVATPERPGLLAALNAGFDRAECDLIAATDDDTEAHPDWLERIEARFEADPRLGGLGGRDRMPAEEGEGWEEPNDLPVGRVLWFGRVVGNHNFGSGEIREVDILKGANMAFRRNALGSKRIDTALRGRGAEHHTEIELCLALKAEGWKIAYDPAVMVDHYEEVRYAAQRGPEMSFEEQHNAVHNRAYGLLKHLPLHRAVPAFLYGILVGTRDNPGVAVTIKAILEGASPRPALARLRVTLSAHLSALGTLRRSGRGILRT